MTIKGRVDKLAAGLEASPDVCVCGPYEMRVRWPGEPVDESPALVCQTCGRPRELVRLRVVYADAVRP